MLHPNGIKPLPPENAALFEAVRKGSLRDVEALLSKGVDPNVGAPGTGTTVLIVAAALNKLAVAKLLLERGANPNQGNALDTMPLHVAVAPLLDAHGEMRPSNLRLARLLLTFGADPMARDSEGRSAVEHADGSLQVAELLTKTFAKKMPPTSGRTPAGERL